MYDIGVSMCFASILNSNNKTHEIVFSELCQVPNFFSLFREKWYGLLFSQLFNSKKSNLVLCVFYPNSEVPWLGPISYLGTKQPAVMADPRVAQQTTPGDLFPIGPPRPPSFSSPSNLLWAKETVLQVCNTQTVHRFRSLPLSFYLKKDFVVYSITSVFVYLLQADVSKVVRYSRKLPDKESSLVKVRGHSDTMGCNHSHC
jgi:hypothetical protein